MENNELIQDTGLFVGQKLFEFSLTESFESITNVFHTIKEYREFANPDEAAWFEYINQFFNILGFETVRVAQRLMLLQQMGVTHEPKALACVIGPKENFDQIIYGLDWESYLFYAAKYHDIEWVILTNGLQFKVLNFSTDPDKKKYFKCELDEIITHGLADSFFTLYKIFSVINNTNNDKPVGQKVGAKTDKEKGKRILVERHYQRREFWTQLISRSEGKTKLFTKKSPGVESYLGISAGINGTYYLYIIANNSARIDLYIDNGDFNWNKSTFDSLLRNTREIEEKFGHSLIWDRLEAKRASVVRFSLPQYGLQSKDKWPELQNQLIEEMIHFEEAFRPYIKEINI